MDKIRLGRTGLMVSRSGFGCIPIQRISNAEAAYLLRKAFDNGINFFDTARSYTDSEIKLGEAFDGIRRNVIIATKSGASDPEKILKDLETSLANLKTDYIDLFQFHNPKNPAELTKPGGAYEVIQKAKEAGKIRFIGITNHRLNMARDAVASGLYDTMQFPLSFLSSQEDLDLISLCQTHDLGVVAMKGMGGGIISNAAASFAFLRQYANVVPIWGIQREAELDEFLAYEQQPPVLDETLRGLIEKDRTELAGGFCRACGYCLPCPAEIPIPTAARISLLVRRSTYQRFLLPEFKAKMERVKDCVECGHCRQHCPYELDTPNLLRSMLAEYEAFYEAHRHEIATQESGETP